MCYGTCNLEGYMGECGVSPIISKIENKLGFKPCFIGGAVTCREEDDYYQELLEQGEIKEMKNIIDKMMMDYYKEIDKLLRKEG